MKRCGTWRARNLAQNKTALSYLVLVAALTLARKFSSMVLRNFPHRSICFLGVYDTVAAMDGIHRENESISSDVLFEHGTLYSRIRRAVHIVAA